MSIVDPVNTVNTMSQTTDRWYAIQTRTQHERVVAEAMGSKGYECFLPTFSRRRRQAGGVQEVEEPLFPGYVFGRFDVHRRLPVLTTPGVRSILGYGRIPAALEEREVEALRRVASAGRPARPFPFLKVGQWVRINHGAMEDVEGILVEVKKRSRLILSVTLLERSVSVDIDEAFVTPIADRGGRLSRQSVSRSGLATGTPECRESK